MQYDDNAEKYGYEGEMTPIELECNMGKDINGVEHREPWKAYDIDEVDAIIAQKDFEIDRLKAENERLKRALWLARAERAEEKQQLFHFSLGYEKLCIDGFYDPYSGRRELTPKQWIKVFNKVYVKCLKKAEEYK